MEDFKKTYDILQNILWEGEGKKHHGIFEDLRSGQFDEIDEADLRLACRIIRECEDSLTHEQRIVIGTAHILYDTLIDFANEAESDNGSWKPEDLNRLHHFISKELYDAPILPRESVDPKIEED